MTVLLAVDPGLIYPGAALFVNEELVSASRVTIPRGWSKVPVGERCLGVAREIVGWVERRVLVCNITDLVIEWPQIYNVARSKGDPADLIPLAGIGMAVAGLVGPNLVHSPKPVEWIGGLPKATTGDPLASPRGARIWSRLSEDERSHVVVSHDALDAVGLGLFVLGRLERRRVLPGAT